MNPDEALIVAGALRQPGRHEARLAGLKADWFTDRALKAWWKVLTIRALSFKAAPRFLEKAVKNELLRETMFGALATLEGIEAPEDADMDEAARAIADRKKRAIILDRSRWMVESVQDSRIGKAEEAIKVLAAEIAAIDPLRAGPAGIADLAAQVAVEVNQSLTSPGSSYLKSGIREFDDRLGGFKRGELVAIGGSTGDGKTTLAVNFMWHAWMKGASGVLIPREMTVKQMGYLFATRHSCLLNPGKPLRAKALFDGDLTKEEVELFKETTADIARRDPAHRFRIWRAPRQWSIVDLAKYIEGTKYQHSLDFMCVDMLRQLGPIRSRSGDRAGQEELNETLGAAKQFALEYNNGRGLTLFAPHQMSRDAIKEAVKRKPTPHYLSQDLQDSSRAEQDADIVMWVLRNPRLKKAKQAIIGVSKARGSDPIPLGFKVFADYASQYVGNLVPEESDPGQTDFDSVA